MYKSTIEFIQTGTTVKANVILKRNDPFMNNHMRLISENWLANMDIQIILDKATAIRQIKISKFKKSIFFF